VPLSRRTLHNILLAYVVKYLFLNFFIIQSKHRELLSVLASHAVITLKWIIVWQI
jgi:hypothetical protein